MSNFPLPSNAPPGFGPFLSGEPWKEWHKKGLVFEVTDLRASISYIRNKPESCRLFVKGPEHGTADSPPQGMNVRLFSDLETAQGFYDKIMAKNLGGSANGWMPFIDEKLIAVGLPFPGDEEIPQLRRIFEPNRFRRMVEPMLGTISYDQWRMQRSLTRHKLIAYKPGRRAVLQTKLKLRNLQEDLKIRKLLHLKVENRSSISQSRNLAISISNATEGCKHFRTPRFVGTSPAMNVFGHEWVEGTHPEFDEDSSLSLIERIAKSVNEFHQLKLEISTHPPPQILILEVDNLIEDLSGLIPELRFDLLTLATKLKSKLPNLSLLPSVLAHGDLHRLQILTTDTDLYLLDFDRAGRGYACLDLGSLMEDFLSLSNSEELPNHFLECYQLATPVRVSDSEIRTGRALACLRRSFQPFRSLSPTWKDDVRSSIDHCLKLLEGVGNDDK